MSQNLYIDGTEMSAGDNAWGTQVARQFDRYVNNAEPYKSSEAILRSLFGHLASIGEFDDADAEAHMRQGVYLVEFPNPYNQTIWIPEYNTHVNVCGETGQTWIADDELRDNPTPHFTELVEKQQQKLNAWQELRGTDEVYNEQAKAVNTFMLFCRAFHVPARFIVRETSHHPECDAIRSVYHPYMITKTLWYLPRPAQILDEELLNNNVPTDEGQKVYGTKIAKLLTRQDIIPKR